MDDIKWNDLLKNHSTDEICKLLGVASYIIWLIWFLCTIGIFFIIRYYISYFAGDCFLIAAYGLSLLSMIDFVANERKKYLNDVINKENNDTEQENEENPTEVE